MKSIHERVYKIVRKIPKRKVATYGAIGKKKLNMNPRIVGFILNANKNPNQANYSQTVSKPFFDNLGNYKDGAAGGGVVPPWSEPGVGSGAGSGACGGGGGGVGVGGS